MSEQAVFDALTYRIVVDEHGCSRYYNAANQLHRLDGPAVEYVNGHKEWWQNGHLHRTDGPAIISERGVKYWYQNNRLHRTNGPAVEWNDSDEWWFINGERLSKDEFNQMVEQDV